MEVGVYGIYFTAGTDVYVFRANREFAQTQDCPAQTRNSNFAAQSWDCADRRSEDARRMRPAASDSTTPSH